jgi:5S rRNA maturation endonuclease (ribonuclease M5)
VNVDQVAARIGGKVQRSGNGLSLCCPAHEDSNPSLSVSEGEGGRVLIHCHAGCSLDAVLSAAGLEHADLSLPRQQSSDDDWTPAGKAAARYRYTDADGKLLFEVLRTDGKKFLQRRPDPSRPSGWDWRLGDVERPLYRLAAVLEAVKDGLTVFVCEGEKDVHAVLRTGAIATCNPHGAGKWRKEHSEALRDADVVVVADKDNPGWAHARAVRESLKGVAANVRVTEALAGKDVFDHLAAGHDLSELVVIWPVTVPVELAPDVHDFLGVEDTWDWLVEGLFERGDRLLLTGFEGWGKSTLIQQLFVTLAAGIHPFRPTVKIPPLRVLLIDCENSERQIRRKLRPMVETAARFGSPIERRTCFVLPRVSGLDLGRESDREWLSERVMAHKPDVLFIGPLYKLHEQNLNDESASRAIASALDNIRAEAGCALVIEAHSGHGESERDRSVRPLGSSLWRRWPEFGYGLAFMKDTHKGTPMQFKPWRGPREERDWPTTLHRSQPWPWAGTWEKKEEPL